MMSLLGSDLREFQISSTHNNLLIISLLRQEIQ
jgi:hypothetical protein